MKHENGIKDSFTPNKVLNTRAIITITIVQLTLLLLWWMYGTCELIPKPSGILTSLGWLCSSENLIPELFTTLSMCFHALFNTLVISLLISYASVLPFFKPFGQLVTKLRFLTLVGLSFIFTLATSSGSELKIFTLTLGMTVFFVTSMLDILTNIDKVEFNHARTLGLSEWNVVYEVIILARINDVMIVAKQNFAMAWMMVTMVESIVRSEGGVGNMLLNNKHFNLDAVFAIQLVIITVGIIIDLSFNLATTTICPHTKPNR